MYNIHQVRIKNLTAIQMHWTSVRCMKRALHKPPKHKTKMVRCNCTYWTINFEKSGSVGRPISKNSILANTFETSFIAPHKLVHCNH